MLFSDKSIMMINIIHKQTVFLLIVSFSIMTVPGNSVLPSCRCHQLNCIKVDSITCLLSFYLTKNFSYPELEINFSRFRTPRIMFLTISSSVFFSQYKSHLEQ